ncbi:error-prone DNA polymerase [Acidimicrobium ferrooxidans]|uniref:error-prone DNA polymerase n=1 Tax=Acidimicrobium ferrooxidans TaxID=53635 RepID=UPI0002DBFBCE|nr:error-prone DNA polymerase [Acidimicrobium ferrooxidans]
MSEAVVELHAHSSFSFLDGVVDPEDLVEAAAVAGYRALALTDHNGLYGVPRFLEAARRVGVVPLVGAELTLATTTPRAGATDPEGEHLVVLAASPEGYRALSRVIATGHMRTGEKGRFDLTIDDLAEAAPSGGWFVLAGWRKSPPGRALAHAGPSAAERSVRSLWERFGDALVLELVDTLDPADTVRNDVLAAIGAHHGLPVVATQAVHAIDVRTQRAAVVAAAIRARRTLGELDGYLPGAGPPVLRPARALRARFGRYPGVVDAAVELAARCAFNVDLVAPGLPRDVVAMGVDDDEALVALVAERAPRRYGPRAAPRIPGAWEQIDHELDVIRSLGFAGYFLVVTDIVDFCVREGIYCQGRGSAANSAVCYALGITNVDPVALGLLFERFLSPERDGPPDIDVDIESRRREEVIQYVYTRYGRARAAQVASVITYRARSALRDSARVFGVDQATLAAWSKGVEHRGSVARSLAERDGAGRPLLEVPAVIAEVASVLEGAPRHLGVHVGGMVLCDRPIVDVCPTEWARAEGRSVLQWDKDDCARMGLVKFDLLGLGMLEAIHEMVDLVRERVGVEVDIATLEQDPAVYEMLARADSVGVFQVESRAQMATLPRLRPSRFYDLVVEVALIRPGPIQGGSVHPYLRRRAGEEPVVYPHPLAERALAKTLGVPLFQEQLMQLAMDVAGFSAAEADELRQAMGAKRSSARMARLHDRLMAGMAARGVDPAAREQVVTQLEAFANFGFPESHAASFAWLVYVSAWFKVHYPAAFYAGLLRAQPMGFWSPQTLVRDARRHGVGVLGPDVTRSSARADVVVRDGEQLLALGLDAVRGIAAATASSIVAMRPFDSLLDLVQRVELTPEQIRRLAGAGALRALEPSGQRAIWFADELARRHRMLDGLGFPSSEPVFPALDPRERAALEVDALGLLVGDHPMAFVRERLSTLGVVRADQLASQRHGRRVRVAGTVTHRQRPGTARGIVFMNLEDETGLVNVLVKPWLWRRDRSQALHSAVLVDGVIERAGTVVTVVADRIVSLPEAIALGSRDFQ